jgi:crossover junction endodeoxyribonuclease RuvC
MLILGIDPGKSGGLCVLENRRIILLMTMPEDLHQLPRAVDKIYLEKAQAMPKQGIASAFSYAQHYGELIGFYNALQKPICLVSPRNWTKKIHMGADSTKEPKQKSKEIAFRLSPGESFLATERSKKPHEGLIDAYLIAYYGSMCEGL